MKNKIRKAGIIAGMGISLISTALFADVIQGEIVEKDTRGISLKVVPNFPKESMPDSIRIFIEPTTQFDGGSFEYLRVGDEIWAEVVHEKKDGTWTAQKVQLDKVNIQGTTGVVNKLAEKSTKGENT